MARVSVLAAGGIVLRRQQPPLIAVVRLRKRDEWVLPKGKLDDGETPRAAAKREVLEETGHNVTVHEFLGTLAYDFGGRSKIVHYWRMEAGSEQAHELMHDVRAVDWLPLSAAVERLSRPHEQAFLANVGPQALASFAARRQKAKAPAARKRRSPPALAPEAAPAPQAEPAPVLPELPRAEPLPEPQLIEPMPEVSIAEPVSSPPEPAPERVAVDETPSIADEVVPEPLPSEAAAEFDVAPVETKFSVPPSAAPKDFADDATMASSGRERRSLARKVRDWLSRAA